MHIISFIHFHLKINHDQFICYTDLALASKKNDGSLYQQISDFDWLDIWTDTNIVIGLFFSWSRQSKNQAQSNLQDETSALLTSNLDFDS